MGSPANRTARETSNERVELKAAAGWSVRENKIPATALSSSSPSSIDPHSTPHPVSRDLKAVLSTSWVLFFWSWIALYYCATRKNCVCKGRLRQNNNKKAFLGTIGAKTQWRNRAIAAPVLNSGTIREQITVSHSPFSKRTNGEAKCKSSEQRERDSVRLKSTSNVERIT